MYSNNQIRPSDTSENNKKRSVVTFVERGTKVNPISFDKSSIDPSKKQYLLLIYYYTDEIDKERSFEIITGRLEVYQFIKDNKDIINLEDSRILLTYQTLEDSITLLQFVRHLKDNELVQDDGFDIDELQENGSRAVDDFLNQNNAKNINGMSDEELNEYCAEIIKNGGKM